MKGDAEGNEKKDSKPTNNEEKITRGIVSIPNIPNFTQTFNKIASQHNFKVATKAENKVRDLSWKAKYLQEKKTKM